jgi:thioester reductase-like protein
MAQVWAEVLGLDQVGREDNFFELGGDSMLAARLVFRLREQLNTDIPLRELFRCQTIGGLAAALTRQADAARGQPTTSSSRWPREAQPWPEPLPPRTCHHGDNVLLTGATGFFGAFLLREILAQHPGTVHCLVRAADTTQAWSKLRANLAHYGLAAEVLSQRRIRVIPGDLARPRLDLGEDQYQCLADEIDLIIHNGAQVDALHSYDTLEAANVTGTRTLLWLAATTWRKPLRFISTTSVTGYHPSAAGNGSGYLESKWRAEQVVAEARAHGIPASIYRVPRLAGDSRTGQGNDRDLMLRTIRCILDLGTAPDIDVCEDWIPVDEAARLLVSSSPGLEHGGAFVLTAQRRVSLNEIVELARRTGHEIEYKPLPEWRRDLASRSGAEHEVLAAALHLDPATEPEHDTAQSGAQALDDFVPLVARGVTEQVLRRYLRALHPTHRIH